MKPRKLVISDSARTDLVEIWEYIAEDSAQQADRFVDLLYDTCEQVAANPEVGRRRDEVSPGIWSFPVKRYQIFYRVTDSEAQIVRVLSGYRDLERLF